MAFDQNSWAVTFYINEELSDSDELSNQPLTYLEQLKIGALRMERDQTLITEHHFMGQINEVQIWSTALSRTEINHFMANPPSIPQDNLLSSWLFDEGTGTNATDSFSNNHDAILIDSVIWVEL